MPQGGEIKASKVQRKPTTIPNKLRARGDFKKLGVVKDYDDLAVRNELYHEFLARKRTDKALWG